MVEQSQLSTFSTVSGVSGASGVSGISQFSSLDQSTVIGVDDDQDSKQLLCVLIGCSSILVLFGALFLASTLTDNVKELVCTVGSTASIPNMYPNDGLCTYIYYTDVFINKNKVVPTDIYTSFEVFKTILRRYRRTKGGLSFDIRYIQVSTIRANRTALTTLMTNNIVNYGFLSMVAPISTLEQWVNKAKEIFLELKNIQGSDRARRTIIALGTFNYNSTQTKPKYEALFRNAIATDYKADVVVVISSTRILENVATCKAIPPGSQSNQEGPYPFFNLLMNFVKRSNQYPDLGKIVGMSLEMGALAYKFQRRVTNTNQVQLYESCTAYALVPVDAACDSRQQVSRLNTNLGIMNASQEYVVFWETKATTNPKVDLINNLPAWHRFSWVVYDVHLSDSQNKCKVDRFELIQELKRRFKVP